MKWLCPLPTSEPGFFLFIQCNTAEEENAGDGKSDARTREAAPGGDVGCVGRSTTAERWSSVDNLLTSAVSFLAPSGQQEGAGEPAPAPVRHRPTTADMRRRAAALAKGRQPTTEDAPLPSGEGKEGRRVPAPSRAPVVSAASGASDTLHFLLVGTAGSTAQVWASRGPVSVADLAPPGMDAGMYCDLLDHLLRPSSVNDRGSTDRTDGGGALRVVLPADVAVAAPAVCRTELRLSIGAGAKKRGGGGDVVLAAVELCLEGEALPPSPARSGSTRLGSLLHVLSAHVKVCNDLRQVVDRQAEEIVQLRDTIARGLAQEKTDTAERVLVPLCRIVNAKKMKIRELTAALQQQQQPPKPEEVANRKRGVKEEPREDVAVAPSVATAPPAHRQMPTARPTGDPQTPQDSTDGDDEGNSLGSTGDGPAPAPPPQLAQKRPSAGGSSSSEGKPAKKVRGERKHSATAWVDDLFSS